MQPSRKKDVPDNGGQKYDSISYDFSQKNGNVVSDDAPQVTFITHGLDGNASAWSSDSENGDWEFGCSEDSIIELLQQKADCNIYLSDFDAKDNFTFYQLNKKDYKIKTKVEKITDTQNILS